MIYIEDSLEKFINNKFITLNLEIYFLIKRDPSYASMVENWSFVCDSRLILYYLRVFKGRKATLNQGHRIVYTMLKMGMKKFLFLGSSRENLEGSRKNIKNTYNEACIDINDLGMLTSKNMEEIAQLIQEKYNLDNYDAIFVALGAPKQDVFIEKMTTKSLIFGCGGTFEFLSDKVSFPPKFIEYTGLTFLWRLCEDFSKRRIIKISYTLRGGLLLLYKRDIF